MKKRLLAMLYLFRLTFVLGATVFGGGYAMLPILKKEFVEKKKMFTEEEFSDILSLGQTVPGLISVNIMIIIGYKMAGVLGSITAVLGLVIPAIIIISILALVYNSVIENIYVKYALLGIRAGVIAVLLNAIIKLFSSSVKDVFGIVIMVIAATLLILGELKVIYITPIFVIIGAAIVGLVLLVVSSRRERQ